MKFKTKVVAAPVEDRSRNVRLKGWEVTIESRGVVLFLRRYHSTQEHYNYSTYNGKAYDRKDAIEQTEAAFARKLQEAIFNA